MNNVADMSLTTRRNKESSRAAVCCNEKCYLHQRTNMSELMFHFLDAVLEHCSEPVLAICGRSERSLKEMTSGAIGSPY
jgi:hypothetical protein